MSEKKYQTFKDFYPFYLSEHGHPANRLIHVIGTGCSLAWLIYGIVSMWPWALLVALVNGYAFAWVGHILIEKNRPATFTYPLYSFAGDWVMFFEVLTFKRGLRD